ncbi:MAG: RloB family protein [Acidobacteriaceae bacterium]
MARIGTIRGTSSLRRRPGHRSPRGITLIVCEGETERAYFEAARIHYRLTNTEVVIDDNTVGSAPISVVDCAERRSREPGGYDQIYCVFDRDGHESFGRAREKIWALANRRVKPLPIKEAISIPCFELWVLLHFVRTDAPFARCADVDNRVRDHLPNYKKGDAGIARQLIENVDRAVDGAVWLATLAGRNNFNPYTSVHEILQHFATVSARC